MASVWRLFRWIVPRIAVCALAFTVITAAGPGPKKPRTSVNEKTVSLPSVQVGVASTVTVDIGAEMVAVSWQGKVPATFSVRGLEQGTWTEWLDLDASLGDTPDQGPMKNQTSAGPAWVADDVNTFQVRLDAGAPTDVKVHALDVKSPGDPGGIVGTAESALAPSVADAQVPGPFIASRAMWGADESFRNMYPGCETEYAETLSMAVVHHTVNSNNYGPGDSPALIRGIYYFHTHDNGWCDIGYNFLIDRFGQIWEGRYGGGHNAVIGGHAGGFNTGSTGISMIGNYDVAPVPPAAYNALKNLLAWKLSNYGIDPLGTTTRTVLSSPCNCQRWPVGTVVTLPTIVGHEDVDSTSCPGRFLYPLLPQLRNDVAYIMHLPWNGDQPLVCDWNGDGRDTPALYQNGVFYIRQSNTEGFPDLEINYGGLWYTPVCGDWNGDGIDTIGVYQNGWWYLRNSNTPGPPDLVVHWGAPGYTPLVGNWNGVRTPGVKGDGIGAYINGTWYMRQTPSEGPPQIAFNYGAWWDQPVVGDWNGDGIDGIGVYYWGTWYVRAIADPGPPQGVAAYGLPSDRPVAGNWSGGGADLPGVSRGAHWYLGTWGGSSTYEFSILPYL